MRVWIGTATPGRKGQTRGSPLVCETDVREEVKEEVKYFFTDLNGDRGRGTPSNEYLVERARAHDVLVVSYVSSYDVSINPTVTEGERM